MRAGLRCRAVRGPRRGQEPGSDAGFTLIEVLVSITLIATVMTALTTFFVTTVSATGRLNSQQAATQLADDATERVRAIKGSAVSTGRDKTSSDSQWGRPVAGVAPYLADMRETWDATATFPSGASAPLPTAARSSMIDGVSYGQNWYLGKCWQPATGGACGPAQSAGDVEFFRVVVAVTWSEKHCPGSTCAYITSTLVSSAAGEPVFNANPSPPPSVNNPGSQVGELTVAASRQLTASGGAAPVTWSGSGLPPGLSMSSGGLITGTPSAPGAYSVTARATDGLRHVGTAVFSWTVNALPLLTNPGNQTSSVGVAGTLSVALTGGTGPFVWSVTLPGPWGATGLPPGLVINRNTGAITGRPTRTGPANNVTVTVTDTFGKSNTTTFTWTVQ